MLPTDCHTRLATWLVAHGKDRNKGSCSDFVTKVTSLLRWNRAGSKSACICACFCIHMYMCVYISIEVGIHMKIYSIVHAGH